MAELLSIYQVSSRCLLGRLPSHTYCLHSHCVRRAGRDVPSYAPILLFLLCGGEFWHAPSFQITGQSGRGMPRKSVLYLPIVPFTQCSCPSGLEGNLGNSGLCAPVAFHPPGFSDNPRRVSHTDLAPPQASCPCRSFARLLEYCFQASGLKAESKKCLSD